MTARTEMQVTGAAPRRQLLMGLKARDLLVRALTTLILAAGAVIILIPLLNMLSSSVKDKNQLREYPPRLIPTAPTTVELNGKTVIDQARLPGLPPEGPIVLQHHGGLNRKTGEYSPASSLIQFRNIYIKELK